MLLTPLGRPSAHAQRGITLLESMVAIVVMAIGLLGIVGVQMRTLADTQAGVRRAQAIRLIEDLSERIRSNPDAISNASAYTLDWGSSQTTPSSCLIATGFPDTASCNPAALAAFDMSRWLRQVRSTLPMGDANVFITPTDSQQMGVMLAWRDSERTTADDYRGVLTRNTDEVACPAGRICHLQYIHLTRRCIQDGTQLFCANS